MLSPLPSCLWIFAGCLLHQSSSSGSTSQCQLSNPNVQMCPTHVKKVPCQQGLFPTRSILLPFCQFEWTHPVTWQPPLPPFQSPLGSSVILFRDELIPQMTRGPKQTDEWLKCIFPLSLIQEESTLSNSVPENMSRSSGRCHGTRTRCSSVWIHHGAGDQKKTRCNSGGHKSSLERRAWQWIWGKSAYLQVHRSVSADDKMCGGWCQSISSRFWCTCEPGRWNSSLIKIYCVSSLIHHCPGWLTWIRRAIIIWWWSVVDFWNSFWSLAILQNVDKNLSNCANLNYSGLSIKLFINEAIIV